MFDTNFFELPMELQLKLRVISDDIEKCTDVKQLQSNLKRLSFIASDIHEYDKQTFEKTVAHRTFRYY